MNTDVALFWIRESMSLALTVVSPILATALMVGLIVSMIQAITSIHEMTLTFIPKILAVGALLIILLPWMIEMMTDFTTSVFHFIPNVSR